MDALSNQEIIIKNYNKKLFKKIKKSYRRRKENWLIDFFLIIVALQIRIQKYSCHYNAILLEDKYLVVAMT